MNGKPIARWLAISGLTAHLAFWLYVFLGLPDDDTFVAVLCISPLFTDLPVLAAAVISKLHYGYKLREMWIPLGILLGIFTIVLWIGLVLGNLWSSGWAG